MKAGEGIFKRLADHWKQAREQGIQRQRDKIRTSLIHSRPLHTASHALGKCNEFSYIKARPAKRPGTFTLSRNDWSHEAIVWAGSGVEHRCKLENKKKYTGTYSLNEVLDICQRLQELYPVFKHATPGDNVAKLARKMGDEYEETPWRHLDKKTLMDSLDRGRGVAPAACLAARAVRT